MQMRPPSWLPWLGPALAGLAAGAVGTWLNGGFWLCLFAALIIGFAPVVAYRIWQWRWRRKG